MTPEEKQSLPANAYTPLAEGESYTPMIPADQQPPELSWRAITWGLTLCVIFTVASAYSGLKVGQVMEAAIPISILTIGLARVYKRRSTVLENVIVTCIGGAAGAVVGGMCFTAPALYMLHLNPRPVQTILLGAAGGCLGVFFLIPLRRYFVREQHGNLPFPEATAITEVLVTGEKGGSQARLLLTATGVAAVYDFFVTTFQVWKEVIDLRFTPLMQALSDKAKIVVSFDALSFILGLGYVMGLRSSMILCAGGFFSNFVLVPLIYYIGCQTPTAIYPGTTTIATLGAAGVFKFYVRYIAVGAIATAGIFGILKSLKVVWGSFSIALKAFHKGEGEQSERTDRDIPISGTLLGIVLSTIAIAVLLGMHEASLTAKIVGVGLALVFSFFFASVAANAIATTARNPISGMTMLTIIVSSLVLLNFGLSGETGMFFVMAIAVVVCTALSVSGQAITDFKTGYWLGSTPAGQEKVKSLGVIAAAIAASLTIVMLSRTYQFAEAAVGDARPVLDAPQAAIMKALVEGFMSHHPAPWLLFGVGAVITIALEMLGAPSLIFALGMYLPLYLNTPALVGGLISHFVNRKAERKGAPLMRERGIIIASGLMAGGALGGVFGAALRLAPGFKESLIRTPFFDNDPISQMVSLGLFVALCVYVWLGSTRVPKEGK